MVMLRVEDIWDEAESARVESRTPEFAVLSYYCK